MARAGRFGTKGLAITFVSDENDAKILNDVQDRFEVNISELPDEIDISSYSEYWSRETGSPNPLDSPCSLRTFPFFSFLFFWKFPSQGLSLSLSRGCARSFNPLHWTGDQTCTF